MGWYFYVGLVAAACIVVYLIPQLVKTVKSKNTESLSIVMLILNFFAGVFFVASGLGMIFGDPGLESGLPVTIANVVSSGITTTLIIIKAIHMSKAKKLKISEGELAKLLLAKKAKGK